MITSVAEHPCLSPFLPIQICIAVVSTPVNTLATTMSQKLLILKLPNWQPMLKYIVYKMVQDTLLMVPKQQLYTQICAILMRDVYSHQSKTLQVKMF